MRDCAITLARSRCLQIPYHLRRHGKQDGNLNPPQEAVAGPASTISIDDKAAARRNILCGRWPEQSIGGLLEPAGNLVLFARPEERVADDLLAEVDDVPFGSAELDPCSNVGRRRGGDPAVDPPPMQFAQDVFQVQPFGHRRRISPSWERCRR
jgi:hypothetical protein